MDFFTDNSIMHGGKAGHTAIWFVVTLLYLGVAISLWWIYFINPTFSDRKKIGNNEKVETLYENAPMWTMIYIIIQAILLGLSGYFQVCDGCPTDDCKRNSESYSYWVPFRIYFLGPIMLTSIGVQLGLVLSLATPEDIKIITERVGDTYDAALGNTSPKPK
jgi:low temperature requirement protein LtrA